MVTEGGMDADGIFQGAMTTIAIAAGSAHHALPDATGASRQRIVEASIALGEVVGRAKAARDESRDGGLDADAMARCVRRMHRAEEKASFAVRNIGEGDAGATMPTEASRHLTGVARTLQTLERDLFVASGRSATAPAPAPSVVAG